MVMRLFKIMYYVIYSKLRCENLSIWLDRKPIRGWANVYNHYSNVKLVADKCSFHSTNPTMSGGETNSFGNILTFE